MLQLKKIDGFMKKNRIFRKEFFVTLFIKQNNWHKYGVLLHTLALFFHVLKNKHFDMLLASLLHDIGKPYIAFQEEKDKITNEYSFHNHEEISYFLIKNWPISTYTKNLVRYHYLIRGIKKAEEKNKNDKFKRLNRIYNKLDLKFQKKLLIFMELDDRAKKSF